MKAVSHSLLSLGQAKLEIQAATSIGYDTQALGMMAVAVALISINVALIHGLGPAWWLPLVGLGASVLICIAAISQPEIETGQNVTLALCADATERQVDDLVLMSIAQALDDNIETLKAKRGLVTGATILIGISFASAGVAQLLPGLWETIEGVAG
jgi:hypothetical protein